MYVFIRTSSREFIRTYICFKNVSYSLFCAIYDFYILNCFLKNTEILHTFWTGQELIFAETEFQKSYCRIFVEFMNHETIFEIRKKVLGFTWIRSGVSCVETPVL